ncbi:MAG: carbohydrate binding domain-containing protein [Chitinivibrionales bacterium]
MKRLLCASLALMFIFSVSAQENLISNGDFSDDLSGWNLNRVGGATASIEVVAGRVLIEIVQPGEDITQPQLVQDGITLNNSEAYALQFYASATDSVSIQTQLCGRDGTPYSDSALGMVGLSPRSQTFTVPFFMEQATDENAQLQFNLGSVGSDVTIALDSVRMVANPDPLIFVYTPDAQTEWVTGQEEKIRWNNSGDIAQISILFSNNGGTDWTPIVDAASNEREFTWSIPATATGDSCLIIVSDEEGSVADTTDFFAIYEAGSVQEGEMVENGQFIGNSDEWYLDVVGGHARGEVVDGEYRIDSIGGFESPESWQIKLSQTGISLESGKMYTFSFDAYASAPREIYANVGPDGSPYTVYGGDTVALNLTTEKQTYTASFLTEEDWEEVRVEFNCAGDTSAIFIDNVSLIETDASQFIITKPTPNSTLKAGEETTIEWNNFTIENITVEFSVDSGEQWGVIAEAITNFGVIDWNVPQVSSDDCFIRIKHGETDSVLGISSLFGINSFGRPIEKGELITNGDFSDGFDGWDNLTLANGAEAAADIRDEVLKVSIDESGNDAEDIILFQNNMPMLEGEEYELSFDCHAAGERSIRVVLSESETSEVVVIDTTFPMPTSSTTFNYSFIAPQDMNARLEFFLGGYSALVSLDNISLYTEPDVAIDYRNVAYGGTQEVFRIQPNANRVMFTMGANTAGMVEIYAVNGSKIRSLKASEHVSWDRRNAHGAFVAGGTYIAVLRSSQGNLTRKFFLR